MTGARRAVGPVAGSVVLACALLLGGCGWAGGSPAGTRRAVPIDRAVPARRTHELPSPSPHQSAPGAVSAVMAIRAFATAYINWDASDVAARMRMLARASVGQARSAMQLAAAQAQADPTLAQGGIANRGVVEGVAPMAGAPGRFVVVTREATVATASAAYQGLAPAWHVTVATVVALGAGPRRWVLSGWQPES